MSNNAMKMKALRRQLLPEHCEQLLHIERLGKMAVHACLLCVLPVLVKGVRRHGDNGQTRLFGIRQSGILDFKLGDIFQDAAILKEASDTAAFIMEKSDKFLSKDSPLFKKMMKSTHLEDGMLNL